MDWVHDSLHEFTHDLCTPTGLQLTAIPPTSFPHAPPVPPYGPPHTAAWMDTPMICPAPQNRGIWYARWGEPAPHNRGEHAGIQIG